MISAKRIGTIHVVTLQPHNWHRGRQKFDSALFESRQEITRVSDLILSPEPPENLDIQPSATSNVDHLSNVDHVHTSKLNNLFFEFVPIFQKKSKQH